MGLPAPHLRGFSYLHICLLPWHCSYLGGLGVYKVQGMLGSHVLHVHHTRDLWDL